MNLLGKLKRAIQPKRKRSHSGHIKGKAVGLDKTAIPKHALTVVKTLHKAGFEAYLVGGCVRDLLLGKTPKDFDVSTDAKPEQIKKLFKTCYLVGRRFRIAHVRFGRSVFEVSTFRANNDAPDNKRERSEHGLVLNDNIYGSVEEDAFRRDFTINAFYYDPHKDNLLDFTGGLQDIKHKTLRMIGDPTERYREDPVRMLRAIRFAAKLGCEIDAQSETPIAKMKSLLEHIAPARLFLEVEKLLHCGHSFEVIEQLQAYGIFEMIFPTVHAHYATEEGAGARELLGYLLKNTDKRIQAGKSTTPAFFLAGLLWFPRQSLLAQFENHPRHIAEDKAAEKAFAGLLKTVSIPKRFTGRAKEIWTLQMPLENRRGKTPYKILNNPRFRAAYDFLLLRAQVDPSLQGLADWWTRFQESSDSKRKSMCDNLRKRQNRKSFQKTGGAGEES